MNTLPNRTSGAGAGATTSGSVATATAPAPRRPNSGEEEDREILSSRATRPNFENFEAEFIANRLKINDKYGVLMKEEQKIRAEIEGFNREMKVLLELKDIHKQPPNLSDIKLEWLNGSDVWRDDLPMNKAVAHHTAQVVAGAAAGAAAVVPPNQSMTVQYFTRLICDSEECKGHSQIMAIHQFGLNNELVDENALGALTRVAAGAAAAAAAGAAGAPVGIEYSEVDYITSNVDLAYSKQSPVTDPVFAALPLTEKYNTTIHDSLVAPVAPGAINIQFGKDYSFKCGCKNHSGSTFNEFGMNVKTSNECGTKPLLSREANNFTYKFSPLNDNQYEPKTVFFCMSCNKFLRYNCLRERNKGQPIRPDSKDSLYATLPVINADMIFRNSLFNESYNSHLERTARDLALKFLIT